MKKPPDERPKDPKAEGVSEAEPLVDWEAWYRTAGPGPYEYEEPRAAITAPSEGSLPRVAEYLEAHLGGAVTAYLSGLADARAVTLCASNELAPGPLVRSRLLQAYEATRILVNAYDDETARSWFFGMNPHLDDEAPAYVLRHGNVPKDWQLIVPAAHELVGNAF